MKVKDIKSILASMDDEQELLIQASGMVYEPSIVSDAQCHIRTFYGPDITARLLNATQVGRSWGAVND